MKLSLACGPRRPLDRTDAWGCVTTNQFVLPGLGSLVAGRRTGYLQAALAVIGFVCSAMFAVWLIRTWLGLHPMPEDWETWKALFAQWKPHLILGAVGFGGFGIAWLWALASSLAILRESRSAPSRDRKP
jgi:hypothetical protein